MTNQSTEARLRRHLEAKATRIISDHATPPGLMPDAGHRHRAWPALIAAAVAIVLIASVPLVLRGTQRDTPSAGGPPVLGVPYLLSSQNSQVLHDRGTTVQVASEPRVAQIIGRVDRGWLVMTEPEGSAKTQRVGLLNSAGEFSQRGPDFVVSAALSPDRTKVAMVDLRAKRLVVVDVRTDKVLAALPGFDRPTSISGWNTNGIIWSSSNHASLSTEQGVWQPGRPSRRIEVENGASPLTVSSTTDRMVIGVSEQARWCLKVVTLQPGGALTTLRKHCGPSGPFIDPVLSPDGRFVIVPNYARTPGKPGGPRPTARLIAIEVDSGRLASLDVSSAPYLFLPGATAFESNRTFVSVAPLEDEQGAETARSLYRCSLGAKKCTRIYHTAPDVDLRLARS